MDIDGEINGAPRETTEDTPAATSTYTLTKHNLRRAMMESDGNAKQVWKLLLEEVSCIYLVETALPPNPPCPDKKVYKFGTTKNLYLHMGQLAARYGEDCALVAFAKVPPDCLREYQSEFKARIGSAYKHVKGKERQLLALSSEDRAFVISQLRVIGKKVQDIIDAMNRAYDERKAKHEQSLAELLEEIANLDQQLINIRKEDAEITVPIEPLQTEAEAIE